MSDRNERACEACGSLLCQRDAECPTCSVCERRGHTWCTRKEKDARSERCAWLRAEIAKGQDALRAVEPTRARVALLQAELDELDPVERAQSESCARCGAAPDGPCLHDGTCARRPSDAWREPHLDEARRTA